MTPTRSTYTNGEWCLADPLLIEGNVLVHARFRNGELEIQVLADFGNNSVSTKSELRALLERLGPVQDAAPNRSFSDEVEPVMLRRIGGFGRRIDVATRLRASGLSLKAAHRAITDLAGQDWALCNIPIDGGIEELARDLPPLDVALARRRQIGQPANFIADVRARHRLSQREFADALGLDVRTLQNWEQGRNVPDSSVVLLIAMFDRDPEAVMRALFEPSAAAVEAPT